MAANPEHGRAESPATERLRALARHAAIAIHGGMMATSYPENRDGHTRPFEQCSHPDCELVRSPEETPEPRAAERDVNMICGIVVCSFLEAPEKDRLCDLVRALAALPTPEAK